MKMKRSVGVPRTREERPLTRSFNSQQVREQGYSDLQNTDSDSDDELSWEEDGDCSYTVKRKSETLWNQRYNRLACLLAVAVIVIAFLVAIVIYQHVSKDEKKKVCTTTACVHASAYITDQMDRNIDPCQDFYQFVCGNWDKTITIPDTKPKYTTFSVVLDRNKKNIRSMIESNSTTIKGNHSKTVEKLKTYYRMCLNQTAIDILDFTPLTQFIKDIGSWTISGTTWVESSWKLETMLAKIHRYAFFPLFKITIGVDDKNSSQYILSFDQSITTLRTQEEYQSTHRNHEELHDAMLDFGATVGSYLGGDYNQTRLKMHDIYTFEKNLSEISVPANILRQPELIYHKMKLKKLQDKMGHWINMTLYLTKVFKKDFTETEDILVHTPDYLEKLGPIVENADKSLLANYMVWSAVKSLLGYLPLKYAQAELILQKALIGIDTLGSLRDRCVSKANDRFKFASGALYVEQYFSESSGREVEDILEKIRRAFSDNMAQIDLMDQATRNKAEEKLKFISPMIGYPDWILNVTKLDKYYENATIQQDQFFNTYLSLRKVEVDRNLNKLGTTPDRTEWYISPYEVNAYYNPSYNNIVFPAGILQTPFYDPDFPKSYTFGTIGAVIGHEMTHGFDNQGRLYDKYGNLENWWSNTSTLQFENKSQCMIDQYSKFTFQGNHVLGERTQGENMADNGGVNSAYTAFSNLKSDIDQKQFPGLDYTPEQLFFMGFGQTWCSYYTKAYAKLSILTDVHSPSPIRPNGVAINSKSFSEAFHCPQGSPMNPEHKCKVW